MTSVKKYYKVLQRDPKIKQNTDNSNTQAINK